MDLNHERAGEKLIERSIFADLLNQELESETLSIYPGTREGEKDDLFNRRSAKNL